ncbi:uncharacterized protein LOC106646469 [Copidosoma floridanum]|uniref:uncharacterized protein LOC106646469 n=1 Tax=Copidosoma floridanum TaxID=29053 RepID=UPI0006C943DB|nr:uncharacterized protein LOC106646469 [Copidosoma floridanum]
MTTRKYCAIHSCKSIIENGISFHELPKHKQFRAQWAALCKLNLKKLGKHSGICSLHFNKEDYFPKSSLSTSNRPRLKLGVLPSKNLPKCYFLPQKDPQKLEIIAARDERTKRRAEAAKPSITVKLEPSVNNDKKGNIQHASDCVDGGVNMEKVTFSKETVAVMSLFELMDLGLNKKHVYKDGETVCNSLFEEKRKTLYSLIKTDEQLIAFTGIDFELFKYLEKAMHAHEGAETQRDLGAAEKIFLCLCKIKLNLSFACLSVLFAWTEKKCTIVFKKVIVKLASILKNDIFWPDTNEVLANMPKCFEKFSNTRVILDCIEIPVQQSSCVKCRLSTNKLYKDTSIVKFMIAMSPAGQIICKGKMFDGRTTDNDVLAQSGIMDKLRPEVDTEK